MTTLYNEILFKDANQTIYKMINSDKTLYGMADDLEIISLPFYQHIFEFEEGPDSGVAITEDGEYVGININGTTHQLDQETKALFQSYIIKASKCNCYYLKNKFQYIKDNNINCKLCDDYSRMIYNRFGDNYNFKSWKY